MDIAIYLGAPGTDAELLFAALRKNEERLWQDGVSVPPPERYTGVLREVADSLGGQDATQEVFEALLEVIHGYGRCNRLVLLDQHLLSPAGIVVEDHVIWPRAAEDIRRLSRLFPGCTLSVFIAMRTPVMFLPSLLAQHETGDVITRLAPEAVTWSEFHDRIATECPGCVVTTWCAEDAPLLWDELLQSLAGQGPETVLQGRLDLMRKLMAPTGFARLEQHLAENPPLTVQARRDIVAEFLDTHGLAEEMDITIYLPAESGDLIETLCAAYTRDLQRLPEITGLRVLVP